MKSVYTNKFRMRYQSLTVLQRDNLVSPAKIDEIVLSFSKHRRLALLPSSVTKTLVSLNCKLLSLIWSQCSFTNNAAWRLFRAPETRASNTSCISGRLTSCICWYGWLEVSSQEITEIHRSSVWLVGLWSETAIACFIFKAPDLARTLS